MSVLTEVLAPFEIWEVPLGPRTIKFYEPLILQPHYLPDDPEEPNIEGYMGIIDSDLAIDVFAIDRDELVDAVYSSIRLNWKHYVQKDVVSLNRNVLQIKRNYLELAELVDG